MLSKQQAAILVLGWFCMMAVLLAGCFNLLRNKTVQDTAKYPERPIRVFVPTDPGASPDLMVWGMEKSAMRHLGQPLVVTNIPGGAGTKCWNELASALPDGYTLGVTTTGLLLPQMYGPTRYHYMSAVDPLVQVVSLPLVAVVRTDQPWNNLADVVKYAKEHPRAIKFGHMGLGSPRHIAGELFAKQADINMVQVPFNGGPDVLAALLGGHIQLMFTDPAEIIDFVKNGRVRVLAVAARQRLTDPTLRDVPTFIEQGINFEFGYWFGIGAPKGLPKDIKARLADMLQEVINDSEFQKRMENLGMTVAYLGPEASTEKWLADNERLMKIIKDMGIAERVASQKY